MPNTVVPRAYAAGTGSVGIWEAQTVPTAFLAFPIGERLFGLQLDLEETTFILVRLTRHVTTKVLGSGVLSCKNAVISKNLSSHL